MFPSRAELGIISVTTNFVRALLVNPNRMKPAVAPIGLDYLADSILEAGHQARLMDLCFEESPLEALESSVQRTAPDVIALTIRNTDDCYYASHAFFLPEIRRLVAHLRQWSTAPIVLGGIGFSIAPQAILQYCGADYGIAGDGEVAFATLLDALERQEPLDHIPGLSYSQNGLVRSNPAHCIDLTTLPPRQRAFIDNRRYFAEGGQGGFETKRGCSMPCCYCADPIAKGRTIRAMPPARVVDELQRLLEQGVDHLHTCDSEFNLPSEHALAVCEQIARTGLGNRIRWYAYCSPVPFSDSLAVAFKRAGCAGINFGVDSGSNAMLARLGRHFRVADLERTAAICRHHHIPFMFDLLVGGPGETLATLAETIDRMKRIGPDCVGFALGVRLYPGTPLTNQVRAERTAVQGLAKPDTSLTDSDMLEPVFYVSPALGPHPFATARSLIAGDQRFFLPTAADTNQGYNYNDNQPLVQAIRRGARGAYWDILRQLRPPQ